MKGWKNFAGRLLWPPVWLMVLLVVVSAAALVTVFWKGWEETALAYGAYVLSFYTLTVVCIYCAGVVPGWYRAAKERVYRNPFGNRYLTDVVFKTHVSLYRSLAINLLYTALNLLSGLVFQSVWLIIMAGYYLILSVMRFLLVRFVRSIGIGKDRLLELHRSRLCAWILMLVNIALSGAVMMMMYQGRGSEYVGMLIYVMALYTFYITVSAVIELFKYRKYRSPVMSTAKVINLTAALVSMLSLETAMLAAFGTGEMSARSERILIAATGAGVSIIVVAMAVYMIGRASKEIKEQQKDYISGERSHGDQ